MSLALFHFTNSSSHPQIFRIQSTVTIVFRAVLVEQGFLETHTPKLQGGASESGSAVFQVDYFGRPAFLAQSPQLYKQMCIAADLKRVFEVVSCSATICEEIVLICFYSTGTRLQS